jgi:hypothetical protein
VKNLAFEQKKNKTINEWHFVENQIKIMLHVVKMQQLSL